MASSATLRTTADSSSPVVIEIGSEVFTERRADGSTSDFPMSYVGVYRRGEEGQLSLLLDCVSPDSRD